MKRFLDLFINNSTQEINRKLPTLYCDFIEEGKDYNSKKELIELLDKHPKWRFMSLIYNNYSNNNIIKSYTFFELLAGINLRAKFKQNNSIYQDLFVNIPNKNGNTYVRELEGCYQIRCFLVLSARYNEKVLKRKNTDWVFNRMPIIIKKAQRWLDLVIKDGHKYLLELENTESYRNIRLKITLVE